MSATLLIPAFPSRHQTSEADRAPASRIDEAELVEIVQARRESPVSDWEWRILDEVASVMVDGEEGDEKPTSLQDGQVAGVLKSAFDATHGQSAWR